MINGDSMNLLNATIALFILVTLMNMISTNAQSKAAIFNFDNRSSERDWKIVNDGVMGGLSTSKFKVYEEETAAFTGLVSLENNGGFASVRTLLRNYNLTGFEGIIIRVNGDGRKYKFRIRTDSRFDGVVYSNNFSTIENEWVEIKLPFSEFIPQFRGRVLKNVPSIDPARIKQLGFLISDKQQGEFNLIIDWIKAY